MLLLKILGIVFIAAGIVLIIEDINILREKKQQESEDLARELRNHSGE